MAHKKKTETKPVIEQELIIEDEPIEEVAEETGVVVEEPARPERYEVGDEVIVSKIFRTQDSDKPIEPFIRIGRIQRIDLTGHHMYLIGGIGWTDEEHIERN